MLRSTRRPLYFTEAWDLGLAHTFTAAAFLSIPPTVTPPWEVFPQTFPRKAMIFPEPLRHILLIIT